MTFEPEVKAAPIDRGALFIRQLALAGEIPGVIKASW